MISRIFLSKPFICFNHLVDIIAYSWNTWRTYCRIKIWFPNSKDLAFSLSTVFKYRENVIIGNHIRIGPGVIIGAHSTVILEDYVRISQNATLETASLDLTKPIPYPHISKPITVKRGAWIGSNALILGGVTIGEGAVVAAGAIVTKDIAPGSIVVGVSAQPRKATPSQAINL